MVQKNIYFSVLGVKNSIVQHEAKWLCGSLPLGKSLSRKLLVNTNHRWLHQIICTTSIVTVPFLFLSSAFLFSPQIKVPNIIFVLKKSKITRPYIRLVVLCYVDVWSLFSSRHMITQWTPVTPVYEWWLCGGGPKAGVIK